MITAIVLGTRPELIKMAPILDALEEKGEDMILIHSGQHYADELSENFIRDLNIRPPDYFLKVGSGTQAYQTTECMVRLEKILEEKKPNTVLVQGDTNTVLAGALTAAKMGIAVGHVEAGLRSYDRRMPEEYNRRVADHVSHLLFAPTEDSANILRAEKVWGDIHMTGNTVIDACEKYVKIAEMKSKIIDEIPSSDFILITAHRAENVDNPKVLAGLIKILKDVSLPVVYPIHPRTEKRLKEFGLFDELSGLANVQIIPPAGYFDFLALMKRCRFILTDSGGIQEEATSPSISKRVLVFRNNTERPEAVAAGFASIVGTDADIVAKAVENEVNEGQSPNIPSPYGDGKSGIRIADILIEQEM